MPLRTVHRCSECESDNVRYDAWYNPNTQDTQVFDDAYCCTCESVCTIISKEEEIEVEGRG